MPDRVEDLIRQAAKTHGVPEALALAVAEQESGFNPTLVNKDSGAIGTFQILPTTGALLQIDPLDPRQNIDGGVKYLRQLLDQHEGNLDKVLRTYGGVKTAKGAYYAPEVLARVGKFKHLPPLAAAAAAPPASAAAALGTAPGATPVAPAAPATAAPGNPIALAATKAGRLEAGRSPAADVLRKGTVVAKAVAASHDPRTPGGRVNLGATVGSIAAGALLTPAGAAGLRAAPWLLRVLGPAAGAALGGGTAEAGNQIAATGTVDPASVGKTSAVQAAYDIGGQLFAWPLRKAGTYVMASRVAQDAVAGLNAGIRTVAEAGRRNVHAVRQATRSAVFQTRQDVAEAARVGKAAAKTRLDAVKEAGTAATRDAKRITAERLAALDLETAAKLADVEGALAQIPNPGVSRAGSQARSLLLGRPGNLPRAGEVEGAASAALRQAGEQVAKAAERGPDVPLTGVRDEIARFQATYPPQALVGQAGGDPTPLAAPTPDVIAAVRAQFPGVSPQHAEWIARRQALEQAIEAKTAPSRTLPGIVGLLQTAPDELPFREAHAVKRMLDSVVNWDRSAKPLLEQATKGIRGTLREAMRGHAPYDAATAAYEAQVSLYTRGAGKALIAHVGKHATPDKAVTLLNPKNPTAALQLRALLVDQAAATGQAAEGQRAWDALRAAWTHRTIIQGPIDTLGSRLRNTVETDPEFTRIVFGDAAGTQTLANLDQIATAYTAAKEAAVAARKQAGLLGAAGEQEANDVLDAALRQIRQLNDAELAQLERAGAAEIFDANTRAGDARFAARESALQARLDATDRLRKFQHSSLGRAQSAQFSDNELADVGRAVLLLGSKWSLLATLRLLKGPKAADVLEYAAYSSPNTQRLVRLITTPVWDRANAIALRALAQHTVDAPARVGPVSPAAATTDPPRPTAAPPARTESRP